jgi:molybdopterin-guanine dinucleotide biosynthesis protein A
VDRDHVLGAVLAGGRGRRLGGAKATVALAGRPLLDYPVAALRTALDEVVVIAKADTALPPLSGVPVWIEPAEPRHPLAGILHALHGAAGRRVLVCAGDLPLVDPALVGQLLAVEPGRAPAVVPRTPDGRLQPLLAVYGPHALRALRADAAVAGPLSCAVAGLGPRIVDVGDLRSFSNVNTPADLQRLRAQLARARDEARGQGEEGSGAGDDRG